MGKKAKGSRKGKKAWRANICTDDIDDYFIKSTRDANYGVASLSSLPDSSLFFLDTSTTTNDTRGKKTDVHREKMLHVDRVLQHNPFVEAIPSSKKAEKKKKQRRRVEAPKPNKELSSRQLRDIWDSEGEGTGKGMKTGLLDVFLRCMQKPVAAYIPAVEVEPEGCSFNPPAEAHQDSLAQAVAFEMQKSYRKELEPEPIPSVALEEIDEEDKFFLEVDDGEDDADIDDNEEPLVERPSKRKKVTRVELNRRSRRKATLKAEAEAQKVKKLLKEIDCLPNILEEIAKEDEEKQKKHIRRAVAKQEHLKSAPPRLGKHKFEPAPPQVLLSEEISGSLRKLKGCCTLASDRYNSLEKRGLLVPGSKRSRN